MNLLRAAGMNKGWAVVIVLLLLTSPSFAQTIATTHNGETIQWSISDNVKNIQPAVWNSRVGTQYYECETFSAGAWSSTECYYEGEFPPVFASNQGSSVIDVSAMITPNTRWHKDLLAIDIGGFKEKTDCGYDCVLSCTYGFDCPFIPPGGTYSLSKSAGFYPYASKSTGSVNPYSGYRITITYTRIRNAGYSPDGYGFHSFNIYIVPTKKQQLEIALCPECKGPPRRDYTDYIGKPYWQGIDVPLRDPRTPDPDKPADELSDDPDEYSDDDYSGTPENSQKSTGEGLGTCSSQGLPVYWVNTATLNLVVKDTDFAYKSIGPDISMTRVYNLDPTYVGMFGRSWSFAYESSLFVSPGGAFVQYGDGTGAVFLGDVSGATELAPVELQNSDGIYDRLYTYGTYWILKSKQRRRDYRYDLISGVYRLTRITDRNGNAVVIAYHTDGTIQSVTDAAGRTTTFHYAGAAGLCTAMTAADGRTVQYGYDGNSNLISTTDFLLNTVEYHYDTDGFMTSMRLGSKVTQFSYSSSDNGFGWKHLSSVTDARGNVMSYWIVSADPFTVGVMNAEGGDYYYESSGGLTVAAWDPLGNSTTSEYIRGGNPSYLEKVTRTDSRGGKTTQLYDLANLKRGNITEYTDARGARKTYTYDADGNVASAMNALNQTITYGYDPQGNLAGITLPILPGGVTATMTYDAKGQMSGLTDFNGNSTSFAYDKFGNLTEIREPLGRTTTFEYEPQYGFFRTAMVDPLGNRKTFEYDANHRLTHIHYPDNTQKIFTYDGCAITGYTDENGHTTQLARDPLLNITGITDPQGGLTLRGYDVNSRLSSLSDPVSRTVRHTRDLAGRTRALTDSALTSLLMGYDSSGNMTSFTDQKLNTSTFSYDAGNLLSSVTDPLMYSSSNSRDLLGRIEQLTNARGEHLVYTYGSNGKVAMKTYDISSNFLYGYDNAGNLTAVTDAGTTSYVYDALNQVTAIQYPDAKQVFFSYDNAGHISSVTYPGGLQVTYNYNDRNRLSSVSWGANSVIYAYDNVGNLMGETRSNTTGSDYSYNAANQLLSIKHRGTAGSFAEMTYSRDASGGTVYETRVLPATITFPNMMTDAIYDDANRITSWGPASYTYDADGNVTDMPGERALMASYDKQNRVVTLNSAVFVYDGTGNRVSAARGGQTTNYYYDQFGRLLFETDGAGNYRAYYVHGGASLLATIQGGADYFYHFDHNGSTVAITNSAGLVVNAYDYRPFGETANPLVAIYNPFTFVGAFGVMDEGNNIYFMKNRFYDAVTGRFMQKDPLGLAGGQANYYTYVGNAPLDRVDPFGLASMPRKEFPSSYGGGNGSGGCDIGEAVAVGNMAAGIFGYVLSGAELAAVLAAPELSLPAGLWAAGKLVLALGRVGGVVDHQQDYTSPSYGVGNAAQDILDPSHLIRNTYDYYRALEEASRKKPVEW